MKIYLTKDNQEVRVGSSCYCYSPDYSASNQHLSLNGDWICINNKWLKLNLIGSRRFLYSETIKEIKEFTQEEVCELLVDCFEST